MEIQIEILKKETENLEDALTRKDQEMMQMYEDHENIQREEKSKKSGLRNINHEENLILLANDYEVLKDENTILKDQIISLTGQLVEKNNNSNFGEKNAEFDKLFNEKRELELQFDDLQEKFESVINDLDLLKSEKGYLVEQNEIMKINLDNLHSKNDDLETLKLHLENIKNEKFNLEDILHQKEIEILDVRRELTTKDRELREKGDISHLESNLNESKNQIYSLKEENFHLKSLLKEKEEIDCELESWKNKYQEIKFKNGEILRENELHLLEKEELKLRIDAHEDALNDEKKRHEKTKKSNRKEENSTLDKLMQDMEYYKSENQKIQRRNSELMEKLKNLEEEKKNESNNVYLYQELDAKNNYIHKIEEKIEKMEKEHSDELERVKRHYQVSIRASVEKDFKGKLSQEKNEKNSLEMSVRMLQEKINDRESKIANFSSNNFGSSDQDMKFKLRKIEEQRIQELNELKNHLEMLKNLQFSSNKVEFEAERMAYENTIGQLRNKSQDLEVKFYY